MSRVLAVSGAALTLVGVVLLLVLAAQAGYFGPLARVIAGAVFSLALIAVAWRVAERPGGRVGAVALAATGVAGLYLDVLAITSFYEWVPPIAGLITALLVAAAGLSLALRWDSQLLALIVVIGTVVLAPVITDGLSPLLLAFLIVLLAASFPAQYQRNWPGLNAARTIPVAGALLLAITLGTPSDATNLVILAVVFATVAAGGTLLVVRRYPTDTVAPALLATSVVPLLFTGALTTRGTYVILMAGLAVAAGGASWALRAFPVASRTVLAAVSALAVLCAALAASTESLRPVVVLAIALTALVAAHRTGAAVMRLSGYGYAVVGALLYLASAEPEVLFDSERAIESASLAAIAASVLLALVAGVAAAATPGDRDQSETIWAFAGVVGLYAVSAGAVLTGVLAAGSEAGFRGGHAAATVLWMLTAIALLLFGLRQRARTAMVGAGLILAAMAVLKLLFFDLAALDGFYRVLTFLAVGVLLLVAGTRYARVYAERSAEPSTASDGAQPEATAAVPDPDAHWRR